METKLKRWLLIAVVVVLGLLYVQVNQARTIAAQRAELVKGLQTLTASQMQQVKMIHQMDDMEKKFEADLKACQK